jgi:NAD(P)-dependent dehydrogenase (short-subunit alcohol dehydrogenase family)
VTNPIAIVTGASRGIGTGIAEELALNGYDLALWARDIDSSNEVAAELMRQHKVRVLTSKCDIRDEKSVAVARDEVKEQLGTPALLVNNAALSRRARLEDLSIEDWDDVVGTNLRGTFVCTQQVGQLMLEAGGGSIVNIASTAGLSPQPFFGAYSATKAAIISFTQQVAVEWGPKGVRCNAISPGFVPTATSASVYAIPELKAMRERYVPLRRLGTALEMGRAVVFLASDQASYINGVNLVVDGGFSLMLIERVPALGPDGNFINVEGREQ